MHQQIQFSTLNFNIKNSQFVMKSFLHVKNEESKCGSACRSKRSESVKQQQNLFVRLMYFDPRLTYSCPNNGTLAGGIWQQTSGQSGKQDDLRKLQTGRSPIDRPVRRARHISDGQSSRRRRKKGLTNRYMKYIHIQYVVKHVVRS